MLACLFSRQLDKYTQSPVLDWLESFALWAEDSGYAPRLIRGHVYRLMFSLEKSPPGPMDGTLKFSRKRLEELFFVDEDKKKLLFSATRRLFQRFLEGHASLLPEEPDRFSDLVEEYCHFLRDLRGCVPKTVKYHRSTVSRLLSQAISPNGSLEDLTPQAITRFIHQESTRQGRHSLQHTVSRLRSFLNFCYSHKKLSGKPAKIDMPRTYQGELPPRALSWDLIKKFLHSIARTDKGGWRDYSMMHLAACYGLRPSEIASLTLESIDWKAGTLRIAQSKTHSLLIFPLHRTTLRLLYRYVNQYRPQTGHSELFLRVRFPMGPFRAEAVGHAYKKRGRLSGLPLEKTSIYSLRHSFAMRLLGQGVGLKEIGDVMGHHVFESTLVYLRLQTEHLRDAALSLPTLPDERKKP